VIVAVGVDTEGRREVLGVATSASEAATGTSAFRFALPNDVSAEALYLTSKRP